MYKIFTMLMASLIFVLPVCGYVQVGPSIRKDGTVVQPHIRTKPNNTINDNFSTKGNFNPQTGRPGTRNR